MQRDLLWSSKPDDELLRLAEEDVLGALVPESRARLQIGCSTGEVAVRVGVETLGVCPRTAYGGWRWRRKSEWRFVRTGDRPGA